MKNQASYPALQSDRQHPIFVNDPVRLDLAVAKPVCHAFGGGEACSVLDGSAISFAAKRPNQHDIPEAVLLAAFPQGPAYQTRLAIAERPPNHT